MSRFLQRFAKLFDFGEEGQLLLQCVEDDEGKPAIAITTVSGRGVGMTVEPLYRTAQGRDKAFVAFDESQALFQFHAMQETLATATA